VSFTPSSPSSPLGLTGATAATRYVGATASGAPVSGTFAVGDFVIAQNGGVWVCTVAGSPGTWVDSATIGPSVSSVFSRTGAVVAASGDYTFGQITTNSGDIALAKLADPTAGKVVGSSGGVAAAVFPPGYEIGYAQITSSVNVVSTTEATGTTIISPGAITFDGAAVMVEFFAPAVVTPSVAGAPVEVCLFESSTQITRLCVAYSSAAANANLPMVGRYRFTPSAASHTYTVTAFVTSTTGTPAIQAGAGGTGALPPAFVRFTKV